MGKYSVLHIVKHIAQWTLVFMVAYSCHLGLRDSDKSTYENRMRESLKFIEGNDPGYRLYMINEMGIDRKNCTNMQIENLKDLVPMYVLSHA